MLQISHGSTTTNDVYGRERLFAEQNGVRSWYANDALGSVRVSLDAAGVPSEPASYDPWGKGGSATFGFTGEFQDTTDLVYLRARWYDPRSATFISRDPFEGYAEQPYSTHPYQYGYANPVVNTDPSGKVVQLPPMDGGCPAGSFWDAAQARCVSPASSPERRYDDPFKAMLGDHEPCGPPNIMVVTQVYDDPAHPGSVSYKTECLPAGFVPQPPSGKTIIQGWTIDPNTGIAKPFCALEDDNTSDPEDHSSTSINNTDKRGKPWRFNPEVDLDWRGKGKSLEQALEEAFRRTGVTKDRFTPTKFAKDVYGKSHPVEWRSSTGAEVNIDWPLPGEQGPQVPHVGYQSPGKRGSGGAIRGHILLDEVPYTRGRIRDYKR